MIIFTTAIILFVVGLASYNSSNIINAQVVAPAITGPDSSDTGLDSGLLNQEIQRLSEIEDIEQDDITLSFLTLIEDCTKDSDSSGVIIGCQIAVYHALKGDIENKLGIDMEEGDAWEGKAPRMEE